MTRRKLNTWLIRLAKNLDAVVEVASRASGCYGTATLFRTGSHHTMSDDYYSFVESQMALVGERTGRTYRIRQSLRVKLDNVDIDRRRVDFSLIPDEKTPTSDLGQVG